MLWLSSGLPALAAPHHDIHVKLDVESGRIEAVDHITLRQSGVVGFRLAQGLEPRRALVRGRLVPVDSHQGRWWIDVGSADLNEVTIHYGGVIAAPETGSRSVRGRGPVVGADGAYLPAWSGWFPRSGDEALTYRVTVQVSDRHRAVAPGRLIEAEAASGAYRAVFAADWPNEGPSLFAGPYTVSERSWNGIQLRTYLHEEITGLAQEYLDLSAGLLERYAEQIGPYPYDDFSVISAPLPVGLGFPGLTYISRRILHLPFIKSRSLPHEVLHNWWGNGIAVDYARGNWAEGLTTFMADYALVEEAGAETAKEMRLGWLRDYAALPSDRDRPVVEFRGRDHDADQVVGYNKAAFVFHMLRDEIGHDAFAEGIRAFWTGHRFETATWDDLRAGFEAASNTDLEAFFAQWLGRPGAPRLHLGDVEIKPDDEAFRISVTLMQDSQTYRLSVPVVIETRTGPKTRRIRLNGETATQAFTVGARPVAVAVDPDYELFRHLAPGEAPPIFRDVTLDPATVTVVLTGGSEPATAAARTLADRLLDTPVRTVEPGDAARTEAPLLIIGLTPEVQVFLAVAGLGKFPDAIAGEGTARTWAARRQTGPAYLVVAADDAAALEAVVRPLPHYRRRSFLAFDGAKATIKGTWPPGDSALRRRLDD